MDEKEPEETIALPLNLSQASTLLLCLPPMIQQTQEAIEYLTEQLHKKEDRELDQDDKQINLQIGIYHVAYGDLQQIYEEVKSVFTELDNRQNPNFIIKPSWQPKGI